MLEAVMNAYAVSYLSLQRRLIARRRSRAFFWPRTTQQVDRASIAGEVARAGIALGGVAAWAVVMYLLAA
jgi:hypothetical protein